MSNPIPVNIISDDDTTPLQFKSKKQRVSFDSNSTAVFIIDDEPTPRKPSPSPCTASTPSVVPETPSVAPETPSVVPETPMVESPKSYVPIVRCNISASDPQPRFSSSPNPKPSGLICLESDDECEGFGSFPEKINARSSLTLEVENILEVPSTCSKSSMLHDRSFISPILEDELPQVSDHCGEEDDILDSKTKTKGNNVNKKRSDGELAGKSNEEKDHFLNEKKQQQESLKGVPLVRCNNSVSSGLICLESDEESEGFGRFPEKVKDLTSSPLLEVESNLEVPFPYSNSSYMLEDEPPQASSRSEEEEDDIENSTSKNVNTKGKKTKGNNEVAGKTRITKEEKARLMNEKKQQKEREKLQKLAQKAEAAEMKKMQKEIQSYEKGKFAQQSIVAKIDTKVVEQGSIGGQLLTRLAEKGITFQITSNPVEKSIVWTMSVPDNIAPALSRGTEITYVLLIFEAEEFCRLVNDESLMDHVSHVQSMYPSHTICYLTNRLNAYINKREQENYKNPGNHSGWKRPPVEQMLSNLTTHFVGVHSRLCTDESELAEHVVGLTCSLASCQFRKKLTRLSVNANSGSLIPKDADRFLIKKNIWLKALIAIPKVQPRAAIAIWKKYPTLKSLLSVYMDPTKSDHEKEFLLENLKTEGVVGDNRRLGEICSKRVYRILMAQHGTTKTDDVENGADLFTRRSS